jgi:hypothetical protein
MTYKRYEGALYLYDIWPGFSSYSFYSFFVLIILELALISLELYTTAKLLVLSLMLALLDYGNT